MEISAGEIVGWAMQAIMMLIGGFAVSSLRDMQKSIAGLNIKVAKLLTHKEHTEKDIEKLDQRITKVEDNQ